MIKGVRLDSVVPSSLLREDTICPLQRTQQQATILEMNSLTRYQTCSSLKPGFLGSRNIRINFWCLKSTCLWYSAAQTHSNHCSVELWLSTLATESPGGRTNFTGAYEEHTIREDCGLDFEKVSRFSWTLEIGSHGSQGSLKLTVKSRMTLNSSSSFYLPNSENISHHASLM